MNMLPLGLCLAVKTTELVQRQKFA